MEHRKACGSLCVKLLRWLEQDAEEIEKGLQGELLEKYRGIVEQEKSALTAIMRSIQNEH